MSQVDYFFRLFEAVFERSDLYVFMPEDADVSKILNDQSDVPKNIVLFYERKTLPLWKRSSYRTLHYAYKMAWTAALAAASLSIKKYNLLWFTL